jgi:hypothetical protein
LGSSLETDKYGSSTYFPTRCPNLIREKYYRSGANVDFFEDLFRHIERAGFRPDFELVTETLNDNARAVQREYDNYKKQVTEYTKRVLAAVSSTTTGHSNVSSVDADSALVDPSPALASDFARQAFTCITSWTKSISKVCGRTKVQP